MLRNIIKMCKELDYIIIIEGVETVEQLKYFMDLGVDFIQGYYYSKPLSENDLIDEVNRSL